jgi:hypothetical protein
VIKPHPAAMPRWNSGEMGEFETLLLHLKNFALKNEH